MVNHGMDDGKPWVGPWTAPWAVQSMWTIVAVERKESVQDRSVDIAFRSSIPLPAGRHHGWAVLQLQWFESLSHRNSLANTRHLVQWMRTTIGGGTVQ